MADASRPLIVTNADAERHDITHVEERPLSSPAVVRILSESDVMILLEVKMPPHQGSPAHVHEHESVGYLVSGSAVTEIDGVRHELHPGDGFRHPPGAEHSMTALGDGATWLEIKSPPARTW